VTAPRLELRGVGHAYGGRVVLAGVEYELAPGRALGLLGPNGSGKSTLLRCIAGLQRPRAGHVLVDGQESCELAPRERARVAYAGHRPLLWGGLSARENLVLSAGLYGIGAEAAEGALATADLVEAAERPASALSQGQRQRLALARALLPAPDLLVLDEPHSGLDEASGERLDAQLAATRGNVTLVLATHERARAERLCDELLHLEVLR
jgi:heme ABC exporter ATP-binding subunit CcmA